MKAVRISDYGGPEVMELIDIPQPEPKRGEVLVKIEAAGLNYSDIMIRHNRYLETMSLPYLMGREFAGTIEALGEGVANFVIGQRVVGSVAGGAMAEYVTARVNGLYECPPELSAENAVAMLVQGITALHCIDDAGKLQAGESVLIHAAAGGVGTLAIQIAKQRGAQVFGTASNAEKCELIRELGGEPINYKDTDWVAELKRLNNGQGADLILESVGGDVFKRSFREALNPFGRIVILGVASAEAVKISNAEILGSGKTLIGYYLPNYYTRAYYHRVNEAALELVKLIQDGTLKTIVGKVFTLDNVVEAFNYMQNRDSIGKVIIIP